MRMTLEGVSLKDLSIMRLKEFEPPEGYYLAFSGGKDSTVLYHLAKEAGVKFDAHYMAGGIDPPELVRHIQKYYPDVQFHRPEESFWKMVVKHGLPTRRFRWCCKEIKEGGGAGRFCLTGIRSDESGSRSKRHMVELCIPQSKRMLHPIIDWNVSEIWEYINGNSIPYCQLYDEGWERIGCVLCPMNRQRETEAKRWPKIAMAWRHAAYRYWQKDIPIATAELFWGWWLSNKSVENYLAIE